MKALRSLILLCVLGALCGIFFWQVLSTRTAAQEDATITGSPAQVWVEATFIQIDTAELDKVKTASGKTFDPTQGSIILEGAEKAELLAELKKQTSTEILGSASLVTISGQQALMQMVEEVRYPTEYEAEAAERETPDGKVVRLGSPVVMPQTFEERDIGIRLNVTPFISADRQLLTLVLLPEASFPAGWITYGSQTFTQPLFTSWDLTTTIRLRDGATLVLAGVPTKNFEQSYLLSPQLGQKLKGAKSSLLLISAKIIEALSEK